MKEGWPVRIEVELLFCLPTGIRYLSTNLGMCCSFPLAGGLCFFTDGGDSILILVNKESVHYYENTVSHAHRIEYGIVKFKNTSSHIISAAANTTTTWSPGRTMARTQDAHHHLILPDQVGAHNLARSHVLAVVGAPW